MAAPAAAPLLAPRALAQDLRFALRMLVKNPLFTGIDVVTLALGIGLNSAVFAAVDALLLRPVGGVRAPEEMVQLYRSWPGPQPYGSNSIPHFFDLRSRTPTVFSGVATWSWQSVSITAQGRPSIVFAQLVSADFFNVLGVGAATGRMFLPEEDIGRGAHPVVVLSDAGWRSMFGADPDIVGKSFPLNGRAVTVVGVAPPGFKGVMPMVQPILWIPLMQLAQVRQDGERGFEQRGNNYMSVVARLKPDVTLEQARARLDALMGELRAEHPDEYEDSGITVVRQNDAGIHPMFREAQVGLSGVVMAVVAILLLVACVNVANLFLARARDRAREMAIRLALGARRGALVRQLLVESLVFSLVAGGVGLLVAVWAIGLANGISLPMDIDFAPDLRLSPAVLGFALGTTVVTGVLFGLVPAIQATRPSLIPALKGEAPAGEGRSRVARGLVVAQMALSIVLLVCAGLFLGNLRSATALDKGFDAANLLMVDLEPGLQGYARGRIDQFYRELESRLTALPGVRAVGVSASVPLGLNTSDRGIEVPGYVPAKNEGMSIYYASVRPGYFAAMGIPLVRGRDFGPQDDTTGAPVIVVNERFATKYWPGQEAVGKVVRTAGTEHTVIGVVPTGKYVRLGEDPESFMWFPQAQQWQGSMTVVVRTAADPSAFVPTLRGVLADMDANLPLSNLRTVDQHLSFSLLPARVTGIALGVFGLLGLLLASVGMYGVMAYSVAQRTREIGIRMAIGAAAADVVRLVMRQGMTLVGIGLVLGLAGAAGVAKLVASVLYGGQGFDPVTFTVVPLVLLGVAALATFAPARRAALVDPAITLKAD